MGALNKAIDAETTALEVARYILHLAYENGDLITNLKLQKLLYYAQAWYLVKNDGEKLFQDDIEAWPYGPVVRNVYDTYKCYGKNPINDEAICGEFNLNEKKKKHIANVVKEYMDYSAFRLVELIHQDLPWKSAYKENQYNVIDAKLMYDFYKTMFVDRNDMVERCNTPLEECVDSLK